jgi:hypothetical protein
MYELDAYHCPSCDSADIVRVHTKDIYDELIECLSCKGIYPIEYVSGAAQPSAGSLEGPATTETLTIHQPLNRIC